MPRGGQRHGAGRRLGSTNRFSQALLKKVEKAGELPVEYLLSIMRDETQGTRIRLDAAKAAAPYVHHKLAAARVTVSTDGLSQEEWLKSLD